MLVRTGYYRAVYVDLWLFIIGIFPLSSSLSLTLPLSLSLFLPHSHSLTHTHSLLSFFLSFFLSSFLVCLDGISGVHMGMSRPVAARLVRRTALGSAQYAFESERHPTVEYLFLYLHPI